MPAIVPASQNPPCSAPNSSDEMTKDDQENRPRGSCSKSAPISRRVRYPRNANSSTSGTVIVYPTNLTASHAAAQKSGTDSRAAGQRAPGGPEGTRAIQTAKVAN